MGNDKTTASSNNSNSNSGTTENTQSSALGSGGVIGKPEILAHSAEPTVRIGHPEVLNEGAN